MLIKKRLTRHVDDQTAYNSLPTSRKDEFFDILKNRFMFVLLLGFFIFLIFLPLLVCLFFKDYFLLNIGNALNLGEKEKINNILFINLIFSFIYWPFILLFFSLFGGIVRIFRQLIWGEGLFLKSDFSLGIKENLKAFLFLGLITCLLISTIAVTNFFFSNLIFIKIIPISVSLGFFFPLITICVYLSSIYKVSVFNCLKMSGLIYKKNFLHLLLLFLFLFSVCFIGLINNLILKYSILIVFIIGIVPFILLRIFLISINTLDDEVNRFDYPEYAFKGILNLK